MNFYLYVWHLCTFCEYINICICIAYVYRHTILWMFQQLVIYRKIFYYNERKFCFINKYHDIDLCSWSSSYSIATFCCRQTWVRTFSSLGFEAFWLRTSWRKLKDFYEDVEGFVRDFFRDRFIWKFKKKFYEQSLDWNLIDDLSRYYSQ